MITLFRNVKVLSNKLDNYANLLYIVVGDPGKALPLLFDQTKYFFLTGPLSPPPPPYLRVWMTGPPPYLKV